MLVVVLAGFASGLVAASPAAATAGVLLALAALLGGRRIGPGVAAVATVVFVLGGWRAAAAVDDARARWSAAALALAPPTRCGFTGVVRASPVVRGGEASAVVAIDRALCPGGADRALPGGLVARVRAVPRDAARGDRLVFAAKLAAPHLFRSEGGGVPLARVARTGVVATGTAKVCLVVARGTGAAALVDRARAAVRARIDATYHPRAAPLGRALVLGESDLDPDDDRAFRRSGLSHLLAVSGTHLVVAALALGAAVRAVLLRVGAVATRIDPDRAASVIALVLALGYADFAGGSGSVLRAVCMLGAVLLARAAGRRPRGARALAASLAVGGAIDPLAALDLSFALSAAATGGLLFVAPRLVAVARLDVPGAWPAPVAAVLRGVATTAAATVACAPVIAGTARELPVLGLAANLVAAPIGEVAALPVCLLHAASSALPDLERGAAAVGSGALLAVLAIARTATASGAALPVPPPTGAQIAALGAGVALVLAAGTVRGRAAAAAAVVVALAVLELVAHAAGAPRGVLRLTALDVGQGDALLLDLPDGSLALVDAGGLPGGGLDLGERVILPALAARRRSRIDLVVLTHPHADHAGGLASTLRAVDVGEVWDSGEASARHPDGAVAALWRELEARGVPIRHPDALCGRDHRRGGAVLRVLAPCPSFAPERGANDNSIVLQVTLGRRAVLLTGDAEAEAEAELVAHHGDALRSDVLKVGHHGSRSSSTETFVARVQPLVAVTSCGVRNGFGHPHPEATTRLAGVLHARTDLGGAIVFTTDGERATLAQPAW